MKPLEPNFEIYDLSGSFLVRYKRPQETGARRHTADSMENALRFIQSFYEKRSNDRVVQFKNTDAEKPRHPYDRDENYWLGQEEEDEYRQNQEGMTTQTQYNFSLEDNDDKTDR